MNLKNIMKIIQTSNYIKFSNRGTHLNTFPNVPDKDNGPSKTIFKDDKETKDDIKKRWKKKKKKNPSDTVYQTGVVVPK